MEPIINPSYTEIRPTTGGMYPWEQDLPDEYWEYRRLWSEYPRTFTVSRFPLHLDIETTRRCNLRCPHCMRTNIKAAGKIGEIGDMSLNTFMAVIDEGAEKGLRAIKLNYMGEPLLHPDLPVMVRYAKEKGILDVRLNTNATLLTPALGEALIRAGLDRLACSFDSIEPERYEQLRPGANYHDVIENITSFVRLRDRMNARFPVVTVSMVRMKSNADEADEFRAFWEPKVDLVTFVDYQNPIGLDPVDRTVGEQRRVTAPCAQLWQRLFVWWDGMIHLCCGDYLGDVRLGRIGERTIEDAWHGPELEHFRKMHGLEWGHKLAFCARCNANKVFDRGGDNYVRGERIRGKDSG